jgi:hypothetical protein
MVPVHSTMLISVGDRSSLISESGTSFTPGFQTVRAMDFGHHRQHFDGRAGKIIEHPDVADAKTILRPARSLAGPPSVSWMNSTFAELQGGSKRRFAHAENLGSFRKKRRWFLPLRLWRLSKAHAWSATVLVDELDARELQGSANCLIVSSS